MTLEQATVLALVDGWAKRAIHRAPWVRSAKVVHSGAVV